MAEPFPSVVCTDSNSGNRLENVVSNAEPVYPEYEANQYRQYSSKEFDPHVFKKIDTTNKVIVKLPEERKIAFVTRRKLIRNMATVEISLFPNKIPMEEYQRLQSHYVYDIIIQVILDTSDSSYDCNKMYSVKVTSLLRNEEKQERSNEKCRILQKIKHGRNNIRFSYKTGYDCEVRKLTKQGLGIEFEVTVMPEN